MPTLQAAAKQTGADAALLAAIGVRESGFQNVSQSGGFGRGIFQIDVGANPQAAGIAGNLQQAAEFVGNYIVTRSNYHSDAQRKYPDSNYNASLEMGAAIRDYNARNTVTSQIMSQPNATIADLDNGTARGNYVSNVLNLAEHCFGYQ